MCLLRIQGPFHRNAFGHKVLHRNFIFPDLPEAFDGYSILHLTDFHLDALPTLSDHLVPMLKPLQCDLAVLTGDYQDRFHADPEINRGQLQDIVGAINARDGVIATLGNHDTFRTVPILEDLGVEVLVNESKLVHRGAESVLITGLDDIHYYFSPDTLRALWNPDHAFKILAVHSPELYALAEQRGYQLYLTGHTHGGQVCLPTGIPIITHAKVRRSFTGGAWRYRGIQGHTSRGIGTSGLPIRFNCPPEIVLCRLFRGESR